VGGPTLAEIGEVAGARVEGLTADDYLRESILAPSAYLVEGWGEGMPSYAGVLTEDELDALVAYLASQS
jgi:mono/diheme cytochrome c family protein